MKPSVRLLFVVCAMVALAVPRPPAATAQLFAVSEAQEIQIGREVEAQVAKTYGFVNDPARLRYVRGIGLRLARVSERPHLPWTYRIVQDASVNAFAAPGGFIFVTKGLLPFVKSSDELAFVLGHETTHVAHRHAVDLAQKQIEVQLGAALITQLLFGGSLTAAQLSQLGSALLGAKYSRDKEFEADHYGVIYARKAGFDPRASLAFFRRLEGLEQKQGAIGTALASHPPTPDRIRALQVELRHMGYRVAAADGGLTWASLLSASAPGRRPVAGGGCRTACRLPGPVPGRLRGLQFGDFADGASG